MPWDSVWCPGADEGTRLESTVDLRVGGRTLPRGAYTLWMIPDSTRDWTLIFSNASHAYHVPYPGAAKDALRIAVRPHPSPYVETLSWDFPVAAKDSAVLALRWGGVAVEVPLHPR